MTDDEIRESARGMVISWLGEWALMLRADQVAEQQGLDSYERIIDRHIDCLLDIRAGLAEAWGWPAPPAPFPFQEAEEWRQVSGYEGLYEVSAFGRVRSARRQGTAGGLLASKRAKRGGYLVVELLRNSRQKTFPIHCLVMEAFVGPRPPGADIRHLDGNPSNPRLSNLAYGSRSENAYDKREHGTDHNAAKTHCMHGHPFDAQNTYIRISKNGRDCRACMKAGSRRRYLASLTRARDSWKTNEEEAA